ncbi:hypothetical protein D3C75_1181320 [compost metagenome]
MREQPANTFNDLEGPGGNFINYCLDLLLRQACQLSMLNPVPSLYPVNLVIVAGTTDCHCQFALLPGYLVVSMPNNRPCR